MINAVCHAHSQYLSHLDSEKQKAVVALAVTGRSLPSNGQLGKSCAKIALYGKNCALHQQGQNCGKIAWRKITIFWGGLHVGRVSEMASSGL